MKKSMSKARILAYLLGGMCVTGSIAGTANAADTNNVYGAPNMYIHTNIAGEYTDELRTQIKNSGLKTAD